MLLVAPKQDFRSSGMKYEGNVCGDEADLETFLETTHNIRAGPKAKEEPGPATFASGPRRAVPWRKENRVEAFRLATDRPGFRSVRRI